MKIYISADIEGVTGINHWDEATKTKSDYSAFQEQMTREVLAACEGALEAGATEIYIKDAHETGRNLILEQLPTMAKVIRGWSGHPLSMVQELDESFAAVLMIGYHAPSGSNGNTLEHTMSTELESMKLNGNLTSEFELHAYAAALFNVPVVLLSGDEYMCNEVKKFNPHIETVAVNKGIGNSTMSIHPHLAVQKIKEQSKKALSQDFSKCQVKLPEQFVLEVNYNNHQRAYRSSFFPNVKANGMKSVILETNDFFEIMRFLLFF